MELSPPPQADNVQRRAQLPSSCADTMELLTHRLCSLPYPNENWWDTAITEIRRTAFHFEKDHRPQGTPEVTALLHDATLTPPPPEAERFLAQRDLHPSTPARAYAMLQSMAETEQADRAGTAVLSKLKFVLNEEPASRTRNNRGKAKSPA